MLLRSLSQKARRCMGDMHIKWKESTLDVGIWSVNKARVTQAVGALARQGCLVLS